MIPTVFLASVIVFLAIRLLPGNIVDLMVSQRFFVTKMDYAAIEHALGMDVPILTQFGRWWGVIHQADGGFSGIFQGNLGISLWKGTPVIEEIADRWPVTFELGFLSLIIAQLIALPVGVYSALRQDTAGDYIGRSFAILCIAVPSFWLATMIIVFPSVWWGYMPSIQIIPFFDDPIGNLQMFILPSTVLGMAMAGVTMRLTRAMMLDVLRQDYIRTAWAKGLKERVVVIRHALKNALIPVVSLIGVQVPILFGTTVIIEQIFILPGLGSLVVDSAVVRDYPMLSGILLFFAALMVLINLIVDLTYSFLDPRIAYK